MEAGYLPPWKPESLLETPLPAEIKCHILYTAHLAVKLDFSSLLFACCQESHGWSDTGVNLQGIKEGK